MEELIPHIGKITKKKQETKDIITIWVTLDKDISFEPGQFVMVSIFGFEEAPISIAGREEKSLILTVKGVGKLTNELLTLPSGSEIGIRGPYGRGFPVTEIGNQPLILVAGGIGLPPVWSVIESIPETGADTYLLYGAKSEEDMIYKENMNNQKGVKIYQSLDSPANGWKGHIGFVHQLLDLIEDSIIKKSMLFVCGPEVMYTPLLAALENKGVTLSKIYLSFERQMRCGVGKCWHCYQGSKLVCLDGPVFRGDEALKEGFI